MLVKNVVKLSPMMNLTAVKVWKSLQYGKIIPEQATITLETRKVGYLP